MDGTGVGVIASNEANIGQVVLNGNLLTSAIINGVSIVDNSAVGSIDSISLSQNSIFNNTLEEIRVDLDGGELSAENNFFGSAAGLLPAEILLEDGSTIDADPFLTSDPNL